MAVPRFKVTYNDNREVEVRVSPKAQVMFERHFQKTMTEYGRNPGAEHIYFMAWAGLHCAGMEGNDFETFLAKIKEAEPIDPDAEEESDPTRTAPGLEPSSS